MSTLAERLATAMKNANISQAELARLCGVRPPSVHGWLNGKSKFLRGENLLKAAAALRVSEDWLATGQGSPSRDEQQPTYVRPDPAILVRAYSFLDNSLKILGKKFSMPSDAPLFADVYEWLTESRSLETSSNGTLEDFSRWQAYRENHKKQYVM